MKADDESGIDVEAVFSRLREELHNAGVPGELGRALYWYPEDDVLLDDKKLNEFHALQGIVKSVLKNSDPRVGASLFSTRPYVGKVIVLAKKVVRRILRPYTNMILSRQADFNASLLSLLNMMMGKWLQNRSAIESLDQQLAKLRAAHNELLEGIVSDIGSIKKTVGAHVPKIDSLHYGNLALKRNIEALGKMRMEGSAPAQNAAANVSATPEMLDDGTYYLFEGFHRGDSGSIADRQVDYLQYFQGKDRVLDVGCGRGEFLALLKSEGIACLGVDSNQVMVESCVERGLTVECDDLLGYLSKAEDDSFGGIFSSQVVEHLTKRQIVSFIKLAWRKLKPGGVIVVETLNPLSLAAFADNFYKDLTHTTPLHPETLQFLVEADGFKNTRITLRSPPEAGKKLKKIVDDSVTGQDRETLETLNENIDKLNDTLFGFQEYAVIAEK